MLKRSRFAAPLAVAAVLTMAACSDTGTGGTGTNDAANDSNLESCIAEVTAAVDAAREPLDLVLPNRV